MTSISYETQHGTTNGPASADCFISKFSGTEGIEQANLLDKHMRITLGKINALHFLYTSLEDLSLNLRKVLEKDPSLLYRSEEKLREKWCSAYWTIRAFFKPGSATDILFQQECDPTMNLPHLWNLFQEYVGGENIFGGSQLTEQLYDPSFFKSNLLEEFNRQIDVYSRLDSLEQSSNERSLAKPNIDSSVARTLNFNSPTSSNSPSLMATFTDNQLDRLAQAIASNVTSASKKTTQESQSEEDSRPSSPSDKEEEALSNTLDPTNLRRLLVSSTHTSSQQPSPSLGGARPKASGVFNEGRRVLAVLHSLKAQSTHKAVITSFMKEYLLKDVNRDSNINSLTIATVYAQLRNFISFNNPSTPVTKLFQTNVPRNFETCGMKECDAKNSKHTKAKCWVLHPELKPSDPTKKRAGPNDNTSAKKTNGKRKHSNNQKASDAEESDKRDSDEKEAQKELKRVKAYIAKQLRMSDDDYAMIAKANESDSD